MARPVDCTHTPQHRRMYAGGSCTFLIPVPVGAAVGHAQSQPPRTPAGWQSMQPLELQVWPRPIPHKTSGTMECPAHGQGATAPWRGQGWGKGPHVYRVKAH